MKYNYHCVTCCICSADNFQSTRYKHDIKILKAIHIHIFHFSRIYISQFLFYFFLSLYRLQANNYGSIEEERSPSLAMKTFN